MKVAAIGWLAPLLFAAVACGPYRTEADATAEAGTRVVAAFRCDGTATAPFDGSIPHDALTPTAYFPNGTPTPYLRLVEASRAASESAWTRTAEAEESMTPRPATTPCSDLVDAATLTPTHTSTPVTPVLAITSTPRPPTETPTPTRTPEATATGTSAGATATARASREAVYVSIGDGIQWGCCGPLSASSPSLFRDYLERRLGRPVIWQTSGSGYHTTDTFISDGGQQSQLDFAISLIAQYRRDGLPFAAITMSIGGNNLVEIGKNCPAAPCVDAFAAGLEHLREQLHIIYGRIAAAKDANTPLLVLLYYDANECTNPSGGGAVDAWNAVIADVAT